MRCTTQRWIAIGTGMRGPVQRQPRSVGVLCGAGLYHGIAAVYGPSVYRNRLTMAASPWRNIWVYLSRVSDFMFYPNSSSAESSSARIRLEHVKVLLNKWTGGDLNPRHPRCERGVIPLNHRPVMYTTLSSI